jgi:hypothetical protein
VAGLVAAMPGGCGSAEPPAGAHSTAGVAGPGTAASARAPTAPTPGSPKVRPPRAVTGATLNLSLNPGGQQAEHRQLPGTLPAGIGSPKPTHVPQCESPSALPFVMTQPWQPRFTRLCASGRVAAGNRPDAGLVNFSAYSSPVCVMCSSMPPTRAAAWECSWPGRPPAILALPVPTGTDGRTRPQQYRQLGFGVLVSPESWMERPGGNPAA